MIKRSQVELLAPAGDEECFKAAIAAGADAVYFGLEQFSARTRAKNITVNQAKYLIPLAHKHNCRAYLTLNTLITDDEMGTAISLVEKAVECGVDAIIVQDLGVLKVIRTYFPDLEIHASTQMTTHNVSQCRYLSSLGVSQVNLSRELSLSEIEKVSMELHSKNIIPEIFVQGAFCISYSGQCYLSGHLYNQAGNRGDCVQPCRRNWCVQGEKSVSPKDYKALFHLKDNSAFPLADKLIKENIPVSLKIEGRIKNAEYVWAVTSAWREQIDLVLANKAILKSSQKLNGAINRDYTCGYLEGNISSQMFSSGVKDISQIKVGTVKNYIADSKTLVLYSDNGNLRNGDRITIKTGDDQFICTAIVTGKSSNGYSIKLTNKISKKILNGQVVYKSSSVITPEELKKIINEISPENKQNCEEEDEKKTVEISVRVVKDRPIEVTYSCEGHKVTVESDQIMVNAQNAGLSKEAIQQKLSKLGGTNFIAGEVNFEEFENDLFISLGELNNLRRRAVELLVNKLTETQNQGKELIKTRSAVFENEKPQGFPRNVSSSVDAYLVDNEKDFYKLLLERKVSPKNFKIIFELPSAVNLVTKELFTLLNDNQDVVLYFNSILFDIDLTEAKDLIKRLDNLSDREILCENTGLAFELKDLGCKVILGANCNIYNSWNVQEYNESLNLIGVILSLELTEEAIKKFQISENIQIWYPKKIYKLLMQSRQCLVRNGSGCTKNHVDRNCLEHCSKKLLLKGTQDENIVAVKREGFYSALYTSDKVSPDSNLLKKTVSVWIIDKRSFR